MPETPSTLRALFSLLFGRWRHIVRVVVKVLVPLKHLLLPEALVTLVALVTTQVSVNHCHYCRVGICESVFGI